MHEGIGQRAVDVKQKHFQYVLGPLRRFLDDKRFEQIVEIAQIDGKRGDRRHVMIHNQQRLGRFKKIGRRR